MAVVVVESPAKAKTINKYLGPGYTVLASYGHVRDLPAKDGSVDPEHDFEMQWEVAPDSAKHIRAIAEALKDDDKLILATDPDREGEAISWHLLEALTGRKAVKKDTAGRARRLQRHHQVRGDRGDGAAAPDRHGAGRRLPRAPRARLSRRLQALAGALAQAAGREVRRPGAVGRAAPHRRARDGDRGLPRRASTGPSRRCSPPRAARPTRPGSSASTARSSTSSTSPTPPPPSWRSRRSSRATLTVAAVEAKPATRNPSPPFMTSTLQQEASRKFGFGARQTMNAAQRLYEAGHITYMRTDGIDMAPEAVMAARDAIRRATARPTCPKRRACTRTRPRTPRKRTSASARPTWRRDPGQLRRLEPDQRKLYDLIWKRSLASQMEAARLRAHDHRRRQRRRRRWACARPARSCTFDGFLKVYMEGRDDDDRPLRRRGRRPPAADRAGRAGRQARASRPSSTSPSRRRATPRRRWSSGWRSSASAGPRPMPRSSRRSRSATTSARTGTA